MSPLLRIKQRFRWRVGEGRRERAPRSNRGFTITEALATIIIVGLVTSILASGIALATRQYAISMATSESQMLYSSLQRVIDTELRYTDKIYVENGEVVGFDSTHYYAKGNTLTPYLCVTDDDDKVKDGGGYGKLAFASSRDEEALTNPLLGSGSYNYGLEASVSITYAEPFFTVNLSISNDDGRTTLVDESFSVRSMNSLEQRSTS